MRRFAGPGLAIAIALAPGAALAQPDNIGGAFSLIEAPDRTVTPTDFHGKYLLVFFGYTGCPDLCPMTLYKIAQALRLMNEKATHIQVLFITVDPVHDTPAIMASYVKLFSPDMIGLSGSNSQVIQVEQEYHVYVGQRDPRTGAIAHSALLYIMRPDSSFETALPDNVTISGLAQSLIDLTAPS